MTDTGRLSATRGKWTGRLVDLDVTDDPVHGTRELTSYHGCYDGCRYPLLYIFCGEQLLYARLGPSRIDSADSANVELEKIVAQTRG